MAAQAGQDVDSHCAKCGLVLAHVVVAVAAGRIARVQCKTCGSTHAHRAGKPTATPRAKAAAKANAASPRAARATGKKGARGPDYEGAMAGTDLSRAKRYAVTTRFEEGDVVDHKLFGLGRVTRVLCDSKIEAVFPDSSRVLVHDRAAKPPA